MNKYHKYITEDYSIELRLLIYLSQENLTNNISLDLQKINWDLFIELSKKHRLISHILKHSEFLADNIPIPVYEKLIEFRLDYSKKSLNYAVHAIRIYQKFNENDISHLFFKGPLLSFELYNNIGYRNFGDIDILVSKDDVEKAKKIIEELDFICIYPKINLTKKQQRANYTISHHYHFKHPKQDIHIELHWNITNPGSFFGMETSEILHNAATLKISKYGLPYISAVENLVYLAAHGAIHQFYRLFWLKDFSKLIEKSSVEEIHQAWKLSKELRLSSCFQQAFLLSNIFYKSEIPELIKHNSNNLLLWVPVKSIEKTDLKQRGIIGKIKNINYRLKLKPSIKYYFDLIFRFRTHLNDWELLKLPNSLFFLYYVLRPFLLVYQNLKRNK